MHQSEIYRRFVSIADQSKRTVGIGVGQPSVALMHDVEHARRHAEILLVSNEEIEGWKHVVAGEPERTLIELLLNGTIDAAVRGTISARKTLQILKERAHLHHLHRAALLSTSQGTEFFLTPVGIDEGNAVRDQAYLAVKTAELLERIHVAPKVGVLSGGRAEDKGRERSVDRTLERAEQLTRRLAASGIDVTNYGILIENAIQSSNVLVAPDGISGNLIFRTLTFLGGGTGHGAPLLGVPFAFVDTSRSGSSLGDAIIVASALSTLACTRL